MRKVDYSDMRKFKYYVVPKLDPETNEVVLFSRDYSEGEIGYSGYDYFVRVCLRNNTVEFTETNQAYFDACTPLKNPEKNPAFLYLFFKLAQWGMAEDRHIGIILSKKLKHSIQIR